MNYRQLLAASALGTLAACGGKPPEAPPPAPPAPAAETAAAPAPAPEPINIAEIDEVTATVEAVDLEKRLVTLKNPAGETFTIEAGPDVRNLPQVKVGDTVVARYYRALAAQMKPAGTPDAPVIDMAAERAAEGERPAAAVGTTATVPVTIVSASADGRVVSFSREDGFGRVLDVKNPAAQEFVRGLKAGDKVELTYTEALAISVEAAAPAAADAAASQ